VSANADGVTCAGVDMYIAANDPTQLFQRLRKGSKTRLVFLVVRAEGREHANAPHPLALLRAPRERT
jgi:hypothetical protein